MGFFDRLSKGWTLGITSLKIISENPALMLFPVISGISLILISLSFFGGGYFVFGEEILAIGDGGDSSSMNTLMYILGFLFYLVNYFIIVFFNVGLVHCAKMIMEGKETTVGEGIRFAQTRTGVIMGWAALAATVGIILKAIQERAGGVGKIITGIIGMVWGIATFFVVPVIAYENVTPFEAVKRSAEVMKEKWGESIGANFSFGIFSFVGIMLIALPAGLLSGFLIHPLVGVATGILAFILVQTAVSAANVVFLTAAYQHVNNEPIGFFDGEVLDDIFVQK